MQINHLCLQCFNINIHYFFNNDISPTETFCICRELLLKGREGIRFQLEMNRPWEIRATSDESGKSQGFSKQSNGTLARLQSSFSQYYFKKSQ